MCSIEVLAYNVLVCSTTLQASFLSNRSRCVNAMLLRLSIETSLHKLADTSLGLKRNERASGVGVELLCI
jgi:hypothetical protein